MLIAGLQDPTPQLLERLPLQHRVVAVVLALTTLVVVLELVRKRKLREEYSLLWVCTASVLLILAFDHRVLNWFQKLIGAALPTTALFFGALLFLAFAALQFSVHLSKLAFRVRTLSQRVALLEKELEQARSSEEFEGPGEHPIRDLPETGGRKEFDRRQRSTG